MPVLMPVFMWYIIISLIVSFVLYIYNVKNYKCCISKKFETPLFK